MLDFYAPLTNLKGIGPKTAKLFEALDIKTAGALLYHLPRTYHLYPEPTADLPQAVGERIAVRMVSARPISTKYTSQMDISIGEGWVHPEDGASTRLELVWFRMPFIKSKVLPNKEYVFYGELKHTKASAFSIQQPEVYTPQEYETLRQRPQPIYSLTKGLSNNAVAKALAQLLDDPSLTEEFLPPVLLQRRHLIGFHRALSQMHKPDDLEGLTEARDRLVYDEFLKFFLAKEMEHTGAAGVENGWHFASDAQMMKVLEGLPFSLTEGQQEALWEMKRDIDGDFVSQRLLQGDVGSGKTILAFLIMLYAVENGAQAAMMAPTEVLARQHEKTFQSYIDLFHLPYDVVCVTGSLRTKERNALNERIATEGGLFIVGTHALLSDTMRYHSLAVVVVDEQHRFGVRQRKTFSQKGENPHVIVMSATPIPRTLAMILYSDMHISVIRDVPARRRPVKNAIITKERRKMGWDFIKKEVESGRQAYIICPLVKATEQTEAQNVMDYATRLREYYDEKISVGLLHGRMKPEEKDQVMKDFSEKKLSVLVSTTVVEVGINVPNATVMMVEDANRFGLAQLHQLRGRVGRGQWQSYCVFVDASPHGKESERLSILANSNDGFHIAGEDLKLRGPGDFFGLRQSGDMDFRLADIFQDADLMRAAAEDAKALAAKELVLSEEEQGRLSEYMRRMDTVVYNNL
ncbi:MAG: ATP-dependent DNA helicase RecG [Lachnospiraceae bacterium]|nr:ATP-dependent DNA helicase RecG [Lachnospiraceae bacterium]